MSQWNYYIIPDLKTWNKSDPDHPQAPIEKFSKLEDAIQRFRELRYSTNNLESSLNPNNGHPYSRLTLGIEDPTTSSSVDLIHVQRGQNVLITDYLQMDLFRNSTNLSDDLTAICASLGFQKIMINRTMTANEFKAYTFDQLNDKMLTSGLSQEMQSIYLNSFEENYANGDYDILKPSNSAQHISEIKDFDTWKEVSFRVPESSDRFSADMTAFSLEYDSDTFPDMAETGISQEDVKTCLENGQIDYLKDWLNSIVQERSKHSTRASSLMTRLEAFHTRPLQSIAVEPNTKETVHSGRQSHIKLSPDLLKEPVYRKSLKEARNLGEFDQWKASHEANCACSRAFASEYGFAYEEHKAPDFISDMIDRFGLERCKLVIASNIQLSPHDGRYNSKVKELAAQIVIPEASADSNRDRRMDYLTNCHPVMINIAMQILYEKECELETDMSVDKVVLDSTTKERRSILARLHANQSAIAGDSFHTQNPNQK